MKLPTLSANKAIVFLCLALALPSVILFVVFVSWRDAALRNQMELVRLLSRSHAELTPTDPTRIRRVLLGNRVGLIPGREEVAVGYKLRVHVQSSSFTIEAEPVKAGKTGLFSFFRDETGVIRFEPQLGTAASAKSRRWAPPLSEQPR